MTSNHFVNDNNAGDADNNDGGGGGTAKSKRNGGGNAKVRLKCLASISDFYWKSAEITLLQVTINTRALIFHPGHRRLACKFTHFRSGQSLRL